MLSMMRHTRGENTPICLGSPALNHDCRLVELERHVVPRFAAFAKYVADSKCNVADVKSSEHNTIKLALK